MILPIGFRESVLVGDYGQKYMAKDSYTAQLDDEISFPKNAAVEVIEKSITGWWRVRFAI